MNEKKKMIITLTIIISFILIIPILVYINYIAGEKTLKTAKEALNNDKTALVYIGRPTCPACLNLEPDLKELSNKYRFDYTYVNVDTLNEKQYYSLLEMYKFDSESKKFGTPYLAFTKNGEISSEQLGYTPGEIEELFNFIKTGGLISSEEVFQSKTPYLTKINFEEYNNIIKNETKEIIVIAQNGCSACELAKPVLNDIAKENNLKINYFIINKLTTEEKEKFYDSFSYFKENKWGTPLTLIVQNNKILNTKDGYLSKQDYVDFFKNNGFIKE